MKFAPRFICLLAIFSVINFVTGCAVCANTPGVVAHASKEVPQTTESKGFSEARWLLEISEGSYFPLTETPWPSDAHWKTLVNQGIDLRDIYPYSSLWYEKPPRCVQSVRVVGFRDNSLVVEGGGFLPMRIDCQPKPEPKGEKDNSGGMPRGSFTDSLDLWGNTRFSEGTIDQIDAHGTALISGISSKSGRAIQGTVVVTSFYRQEVGRRSSGTRYVFSQVFATPSRIVDWPADSFDTSFSASIASIRVYKIVRHLDGSVEYDPVRE